MKVIAKLGLILLFWFFYLTPVSAHGWGHHGDCCHSGNDMGPISREVILGDSVKLYATDELMNEASKKDYDRKRWDRAVS